MHAVFSTKGYRVLGATVLGAIAVLFAVQALHGFAVGWGVAPVAALLALRGATLKLEVQDDALFVRSWLRSSRVPLSDIRTFGVLPYAGFWLKGGSLGWIEGLAFTDAAGAEHRLAPIVGLVDRGPTRIARQLNLCLAAARSS